MINYPLPLLGFSAFSGTGKTTLLTQLLPLLRNQGLRIAVVKHAHHQFEIDHPDKDSYALRKAGAVQMLVASRRRMALITEFADTQAEPSLQRLLESLDPDRLDLVLVEGFKREAFHKIELHRPSLGKPLLYPTDPDIIALASDEPMTDLPAALAQLDLNDPSAIADFIQHRIRQFRRANLMPSNVIRTTVSCSDAETPETLTVAAARERILASVTPIRTDERLALRDALERVLATDIVSPVDVPGHTNSAMDGYAMAGSDLPEREVRDFSLCGSAFAGVPFASTCPPGTCVRIMTGAPMPPGTDTVVMQEQAMVINDQLIRIGGGHRRGQNVRQAGEDIARGSIVLQAGKQLMPADLGVLASLGFGEISVRRRPRVAFFSTGDELRSIGERLGEGEVYDSNRYSLFGMLKRKGVDWLDMGVVKDDPDALRQAFESAAEVADLVISSGGVSVGEADYTKTILQQQGDMCFWKIAMKPGRPLTFGKLGKALFFGLPGNPVAVMVTFYQFVLPALHTLASDEAYVPFTLQAESGCDIRKRPGRFEFIRGVWAQQDDGTLSVNSAGQQGSGILTSMSRSNCFILLDEACEGVTRGDKVTIQPFSSLI